jgi:glycosyltransferase involved in cell wall biosynthesis
VAADPVASRGRLLVVSHPCAVAVNQAVYAQLQELGWEPLVVVPNRWRHDYAPEAFRPRPLPALEGRLRHLRVLLPGRPQRHFYLARPRRLLQAFRPHAAFVEQEAFSLSAFQWGLALAKAAIPFGVQAAENVDRRLRRPAPWIRSRILRRAAFVAARSPAAAALVRRLGAAGEVVLAPHPVPNWDTPAHTNGRPFTIGFAGRLVPDKGIDDLVRAASRLEAPVRLLLAGDGPLRNELQRASLPCGEIAIWTGLSHDRVCEAYAEMDVLVLPSRSTPRGAEQFGRVLVEALWCGVPVIGSDCGEIPWVIETTGGGRVFREGDAGELAAILEDLRRQPEHRAELAERGRSAVRRLFSVQAAAETLDRALVAAQGGGK